MRHFRTTSLLALLLVFLPVFAFGTQQKKSLDLDRQATVGTQDLKPGHYTLKFDDSAPQTNVEFQLDGKTVATVPAQVKQVNNNNNAAFEFDTAGGQYKLDRVYVGHSKELLLDNAQASNSSNQQTSTPPSQ